MCELQASMESHGLSHNDLNYSEGNTVLTCLLMFNGIILCLVLSVYYDTANVFVAYKQLFETILFCFHTV